MPLKIDMLEALMRRLPHGHAKQPAIIEDIKKIKAGYNGENRVFQSLKSLPEKEYLLFHDLRLIGSSFPFQMDILVLTSSFLLILEVKNMAGEIFFDKAFKSTYPYKSRWKNRSF